MLAIEGIQLHVQTQIILCWLYITLNNDLSLFQILSTKSCSSLPYFDYQLVTARHVSDPDFWLSPWVPLGPLGSSPIFCLMLCMSFMAHCLEPAMNCCASFWRRLENILESPGFWGFILLGIHTFGGIHVLTFWG